jgi:hypothetical protein
MAVGKKLGKSKKAKTAAPKKFGKVKPLAVIHNLRRYTD